MLAFLEAGKALPNPRERDPLLRVQAPLRHASFARDSLSGAPSQRLTALVITITLTTIHPSQETELRAESSVFAFAQFSSYHPEW